MESQIVDACICFRLTQYHCFKTGNKTEDIVASTFPRKKSHCKVLSGYQSTAVQLSSTHTYMFICISVLCMVYFNIIKIVILKKSFKLLFKIVIKILT